MVFVYVSYLDVIDQTCRVLAGIKDIKRSVPLSPPAPTSARQGATDSIGLCTVALVFLSTLTLSVPGPIIKRT